MKPLMSKKCISLFEIYLTRDKILLEIGSGGSTCYFYDKVKKMYSIESNETWYNDVKKYLDSNNITNVEYKLIKSNYEDKNLGGRYWTYEMYKNYVDEINNFDFKFDIIFIDGMARPHCYLKSFNQIKDDGFVIIHDFYNNSNIDKEWNISLLFKYYEEVDSIKKCRGKHKGVERGNDVIILKKKNIEYDENDMNKLDEIIPRY
jgi:predicted O-methyltransferase YrrM